MLKRQCQFDGDRVRLPGDQAQERNQAALQDLSLLEGAGAARIPDPAEQARRKIADAADRATTA